jgi:hypothetical protein
MLTTAELKPWISTWLVELCLVTRQEHKTDTQKHKPQQLAICGKIPLLCVLGGINLRSMFIILHLLPAKTQFKKILNVM